MASETLADPHSFRTLRAIQAGTRIVVLGRRQDEILTQLIQHDSHSHVSNVSTNCVPCAER